MFLYFLKVTICWLVFYLVYSKFLSKETFFKTNRWYLLGTLLLGAGIPLLEFLPIFQEDNPVVIYFQPISDGSFYVQSAVNEVVANDVLNWNKLFLGIYLVGVVICSIRFFIGLGKIYALFRASEVIQKENHTLVLTNEPHLPFSFFKYMFWSKDLEMNDVDGQKIVTHEVAHVKGWHSVDVILLEIFSIIFWVSPMVYLYKKSLKTVHEYLADAVVLQTTPTKRYGHLLLRQSQSGLQIALANHFFHSQLKQRIVMMTRSKSRKEAIVKYLFALPVILLLLIAFSKKEAMANKENFPTENIEISNLEALNSKMDIVELNKNNVDEMPRFPGCEEISNKAERDKCAQTKLLTFIYSNIKYPAEARKAGIQGRVIIKYTVQKDGTIAKARIEREIGGGCGDAALKVVKTLPKMIPGQKDGKAVAVAMTLPVSFKLDGASKKEDKAEVENIKNAMEQINIVAAAPKNKMSKGGKNTTLEELLEAENVSFKINGNVVSSTEVKALSPDEIATIDVRDVTEVTGNEGKKDIITSKMMVIIRTKKNLPQSKVENSDLIFKVVEEMPRFKNEDCEKMDIYQEKKKCAETEMLKFIYSNVKYPKEASKAGIQGRVIIKFVVQKDGSIADAKVLRDPGGGCGAEAERVVNMMPKWIPGKQRGEKVNVSYTLPISFKLAEPDSDAVMKNDEKNIKINKDMKPLFIVDGKEFDKSVAGELNPDDIATVNVFKGEKAIEKYGDKGKNGVVEIVLKEGNSKITESRTHPVEKKATLEKAWLTYVKISPNPTSGNIDIEYGSQDKPMTITILDLNGKEIFSKNVVGGRSSLQNVDVSKAAKGILLISFYQDGRTYTEKIVLQ